MSESFSFSEKDFSFFPKQPLKSLQKFQEACFFDNAQINYKIIGVAIPGERSMKRVIQTSQLFSINKHQAQIVSVPQTCIKNCQLAWTDLLKELK